MNGNKQKVMKKSYEMVDGQIKTITRVSDSRI